MRHAIDTALERASASLFPDLWKPQAITDDERALLRAVAGDQPMPTDSAVFRSLAGMHYLVERDGIAAFAFPLFGRWVRDHAP